MKFNNTFNSLYTELINYIVMAHYRLLSSSFPSWKSVKLLIGGAPSSMSTYFYYGNSEHGMLYLDTNNEYLSVFLNLAIPKFELHDSPCRNDLTTQVKRANTEAISILRPPWPKSL